MQPVSCEGVVTEWHYQAVASHSFQVIVWRSLQNEDKLLVVGVTDIVGGPVGEKVTYIVPVNERFEVKHGDLIGWSHNEPILPWSSPVNCHVTDRIAWIKGNDTVKRDQVFPGSNFNGTECRQYSIQATVSSGEGKLYFEVYFKPYFSNHTRMSYNVYHSPYPPEKNHPQPLKCVYKWNRN